MKGAIFTFAALGWELRYRDITGSIFADGNGRKEHNLEHKLLSWYQNCGSLINASLKENYAL